MKQLTNHTLKDLPYFLRAVIDGVHSEFTMREVLQKYQLGSSANVSIVKRALVKKEFIEIEKRQVVIPDPVMTVWLKTGFGNVIYGVSTQKRVI